MENLTLTQEAENLIANKKRRLDLCKTDSEKQILLNEIKTWEKRILEGKDLWR